MIRGLTGVISGFALWSVLWCGLNVVLPMIFRKQFNLDGTTDNALINLLIVLLSFDFSFFSGYINAIIARVHQMRFAILQGVIQLGVGIYVQRQYWELLPLWFHLTFLILIIPGIVAGCLYRLAHERAKLTLE